METICNPSRVEQVITDVSPAALGVQNGEHRTASLPQGDQLVLALGQQAGSRDSPHGAGLRHRPASRHGHAPVRGLT